MLLHLSVIDKGRKNVEILKQGEHCPVLVEDQAAIIFCGTNALLKEVPLTKVREFEIEFRSHLNLNHKDIMARLAKGELSDEITDVLTKVAKEFSAKYKK
jgi:F-type H+/Na+-transporting ATPase subunit alpha